MEDIMWEHDLTRGEMAIVMFASGRVELQRGSEDGLRPAVISLPIRTWHGLAALIESLTGTQSSRPGSQPLRLSFGDVRLAIEPTGSVVLEYEGEVVWFSDATERWAFLHTLELGRQVLADPAIAACQIVITSSARQTGQIIQVARRTELPAEDRRPAVSLSGGRGSPVTQDDVEFVRRIVEPTETLGEVLRALRPLHEVADSGDYAGW